MSKTSIEWTQSDDGTPGMSLNPIAAFRKDNGKRGWACVHASGGCRFCYAENINRRFGTGLAFAANNLDKVEFRVVEKIMREPFSWRKPVRCFPFDMTDWALIAERNPELMDQFFAVMARTPHVTYMLLTKRPDLALAYLGDMSPGSKRVLAIRQATAEYQAFAGFPKDAISFPLKNGWFGISAEDQSTLDERAPILLQTPAALRFISYEPSIGPLPALTAYLGIWHCCPICGWTPIERHGMKEYWDIHGDDARCIRCDFRLRTRCDWVVAGSESGPRARPYMDGWFRSVRDQCQAAGVPYFQKQITERGLKIPYEMFPEDLRIREFPQVVA
jgi:protein gp37